MEKREGQAHCGQCKKYKPFGEFASSQRHNGGWCRSCHKAKYRETRPALPPRSCEVCGAQVEEPKPKQRFCSNACKMKARYWRLNPPEKRSCQICSADITHLRRDARFCTEVCAAKFNNGKKTPEQRRAYKIRSNYGISVEDYDRMLAEQSGGCAICGDSGATSRGGILHVDHCHNSNKVRGLLCESCNLALGKFKDDPALLRRAADYLERDTHL